MSGKLSDYVQGGKKSDSMSSLLSNSTTITDSLAKKWSNFTGNNGNSASSETPVTDEETDKWFSSAKTDPCLPSLTKKQRILGFMFCIVLGIFCFFMCSLYLPFIVLKARKFALMYSLGSMFFIMSFAALWGPVNHLKHLLSGDRLPFTAIYFLTIMATLYFAMWRRSSLMTALCAVVQLLAMVWYIISYIPGGQTGLKFFYKIFYSFSTRTASAVLPV